MVYCAVRHAYRDAPPPPCCCRCSTLLACLGAKSRDFRAVRQTGESCALNQGHCSHMASMHVTVSRGSALRSELMCLHLKAPRPTPRLSLGRAIAHCLCSLPSHQLPVVPASIDGQAHAWDIWHAKRHSCPGTAVHLRSASASAHLWHKRCNLAGYPQSSSPKDSV